MICSTLSTLPLSLYLVRINSFKMLDIIVFSALLTINSKMIIQRSWVELYETVVGHFQFYNHPSVISVIRFVGLSGFVESLQPYVDQVDESIKSLNVTEDSLTVYIELFKTYSLTSWKLAFNFIRPYKPAINPLIGKVKIQCRRMIKVSDK